MTMYDIISLVISGCTLALALLTYLNDRDKRK